MSKTRTAFARNVPDDLWIKFKAEAVRRNMTIGQAISEAIRGWLNNTGD